MTLNVDRYRLHAALDIVLDAIVPVGRGSVELERDYFWTLDPSAVLDPSRDPGPPGIGQLSECLADVEALAAEPGRVIPYDLVRIGDLLRGIGLETGERWTPPEDAHALAEFAEVVLDESVVLGVSVVPDELRVTCDLALAARHPRYRAPARSARRCFRHATVVFAGLRDVRWTGVGTPGSTDATGQRGWGHIDGLTVRSGTVVFACELGRIEARFVGDVEVIFTGDAA